jgi:hypothetical protein
MISVEKPDLANLDTVLEYIDDINWSGIDIAPLGARYVGVTFGLELEVARKVVSYWLHTYAERHPHG